MIFALAPVAALLLCVALHVLVSRVAPMFSRFSAIALSVFAGLAAIPRLAILERAHTGEPVDPGMIVARSLAYPAFAYTYAFGLFNLA